MPRGYPRGPGVLSTAAAAAALVVSGLAATALLSPGGTIESAPVDLGDHFTAAQLDRADDFRGPQRALGLAALAAQVALLALFASGRPGAIRRGLERCGQRPVALGAVAAGLLYLAVAAVATPFALIAHERASDFGLSTQTGWSWAADRATAAGISAVIAGLLGAAALALMGRAGRRWWLPAAPLLAAVAVVFTWIVPVTLAPVFNDFEPLPPGPARADAEGLAERAGVDVGEVLRVDASRRTTGINAYVDGVGPTKRVVLFDTLIDELDRDERRSVIAHELAHAEGRDIPRGLLWLALVAPAALALVSGLTAVTGARAGFQLGVPGILPAFGLALIVVSVATNALGNGLSREVEARADAFALELTDDPQALIEVQRRLDLSNLGDPDPPGLHHAIFGTHPTTAERIGYAIAWRRGARP